MDDTELKRVAEALAYPDPWHVEGFSVCSPAGFTVAEAAGSASDAFERSRRAEFIATFSPPTVLNLLARLSAAEARVGVLEEALRDARVVVGQLTGVVVEFGNLNGFRNLSDQELGSAVISVARAGASMMTKLDAALDAQALTQEPTP